MKRGVPRDSEELSFHLANVKGCLQNVMECCKRYSEGAVSLLIPATEDDSCREKLCRWVDASNRLSQNVSYMLRACLHMYTSLDHGLNYMDDPARNAPEVQECSVCACSAMQELLACQEKNILLMGSSSGSITSSTGIPAVAPSFQGISSAVEPLSMLQNTLNVLHQEMVALQNSASNKQFVNELAVMGRAFKRRVAESAWC
jgi:hypothetical protein